MTICIATNSYYPSIGGIPGYYKYLADIVTSFGHKVIILTIDASPAEVPDTVEDQGPVLKVTLRSTYLKYLGYYKKYFRPGGYSAHQWIAMGYAMREWLLKNSSHYLIDIIETTDFGGAGIFLVADTLPPVIVVGHSSASQISEHSYMRNDDHFKVIKQLEQLSFTFCDGIVAHSPMNQHDLGRLAKRDIYFARAPWVVPAYTDPYNAESKIDHLVVSSLQMIKGAETMAEATRIAQRKEPSLKIHWIGGDSHTAPGGEKVSSFLERNYADIWHKNFIWMGEKEHPATLDMIRTAGTAIIPSRWETFNYFALEAIFFEKPLVITESTGVSYLFKEEKKNWVIPADDPGKLSEALLEQVFAGKESKQEIKAIKEKIIDYFSPMNIMKDREELYNACQNSRTKNAEKAIESLSFIENYTTVLRKYYYQARHKLKRIIKKEI